MLKEKFVYIGYGIAFDGVGEGCFNNGSVVITFGVDSNSPSDADNQKNDFLVLGEGPNFGINWNFNSPEKKFNINFSKANTKFWVCIIMAVIAIYL